jgi:GNAT superfamily N-acetyltransferase
MHADCLDLEMLGTRPEYAGRGLASRLLRWGLERADEVGLETYLSASPLGRPLYEKFGFRLVEEREVAGGYVQGYMLRPARVIN